LGDGSEKKPWGVGTDIGKRTVYRRQLERNLKSMDLSNETNTTPSCGVKEKKKPFNQRIQTSLRGPGYTGGPSPVQGLYLTEKGKENKIQVRLQEEKTRIFHQKIKLERRSVQTRVGCTIMPRAGCKQVLELQGFPLVRTEKGERKVPVKAKGGAGNPRSPC